MIFSACMAFGLELVASSGAMYDRDVSFGQAMLNLLRRSSDFYVMLSLRYLLFPSAILYLNTCLMLS